MTWFILGLAIGTVLQPFVSGFRRGWRESRGGFYGGVDVLPHHHVNPEDAPKTGGLQT